MRSDQEIARVSWNHGQIVGATGANPGRAKCARTGR